MHRTKMRSSNHNPNPIYYTNGMDLLEFIKQVPVIGILRDIPQGAEEACAKTAAACGLKAIEVTMNTAGAEAIIASLKQAVTLDEKNVSIDEFNKLFEAK